MLIGYARVSTTGQNLESQIEHLQAEGCDKIFQEKLTGFDRRRPQLEKMLKQIEPGDTLIRLSGLPNQPMGMILYFDQAPDLSR